MRSVISLINIPYQTDEETDAEEVTSSRSQTRKWWDRILTKDSVCTTPEGDIHTARGSRLYHCLELVWYKACATVHYDPVSAQVYFLQISFFFFFCADAIENTKNRK